MQDVESKFSSSGGVIDHASRVNDDDDINNSYSSDCNVMENESS